VVELSAKTQIAAVISSYAAPLLEGCGTIKKGDLRVVGRTEDVPFITAFATNTVDAARQERITAALLAVGEDPVLCKALESLVGFVPIEENEPQTTGTVSTESAAKKK
jgi:ABC-type phosphate/phosphonate transport system substrate-binding protein